MIVISPCTTTKCVLDHNSDCGLVVYDVTVSP